MPLTTTATYDFYGLHVQVSGDPALVEDLQRDFSFFRGEIGHPHLSLVMVRQSYDRASLPRLKATLQSPRNIVYRADGVIYGDYFGRALSVYRTAQRRWEIFSQDRDLAHEVAFLTILSRVGQHLDSVGLHRVHALGVAAGNRAVLVLLPMAGGKTTLALKLLNAGGIRLLSEDSPLLGPNGQVHPFPLRIGVRPGGEPPEIPAHFWRTVQRMEFGPKTLIDISYFQDRLASPCQVGAILLGERWLTGPSSIRPGNRRAAFKEFMKNCVVGLGLYQGVEFILERSPMELLGQTSLALSRLRRSLEVISRAQVYRFALGQEVEETAVVLLAFLRDFAAQAPGGASLKQGLA
jgi:hypothetical protein